jgi:serine phosphatase RsbU (regulator of sigma subunit)
MSTSEVREHGARHGVRDAMLRAQLSARRERLRRIPPGRANAESVYRLIEEVDAALERMDRGTFGLCEVCHEDIEPERLMSDPLGRNCLDHLSPVERRALERDLDLALQIQRGLLPRAGEFARGWTMAYHYRPAGPVGGDYCDAIALEDGSGFFFLGDVTGKGVAASMLTAHLHAIFRSLIGTTTNLPEMMSKANRVFCDGTMTTLFATLACGRFWPDGRVEICNAGHCPPLHLRGGSASTVEATGIPLGLFADAEFGSYHAEFGSDDCLVIYSDGLSETFNRDGVPYGASRPTELLKGLGDSRPEQLIAGLLTDLDAFRVDQPVKDDLSLMVIRRGS